MNILFFSHHFNPDIGGIESHSESLANYLKKQGEEVNIVTWSKNENISRNFPYEIIRNPSFFKLIQVFMWADVVFENNPSLKLSWLNYFFRKPHIVVLHTWITRSNERISFKDKIKTKYLDKPNTVIAVSEKLKMHTYKKAIVIHNSYNQHLFRRNEEIEKTKDFVFLGRLVSDKGADMAVKLIKGLNELKDNKASIKYSLTIIGSGEEKENLEQLVNQHNLEKYVDFKGTLTQDNLVQELNRHRYILVPSRWREPFGLVALEGMACGCLPIVSNGGGLPEAIGESGIVFNRNNQTAFFKTVKKLLDSPELESNIRKKMPKHLEEHHMEVISNKYHQIIKDLTDEKHKVNSFASNG